MSLLLQKRAKRTLEKIIQSGPVRQTGIMIPVLQTETEAQRLHNLPRNVQKLYGCTGLVLAIGMDAPHFWLCVGVVSTDVLSC